ncbi:SDR family oxidoreductase [Streptomyces sp. NPDC057376]|uniref:SDR family oxidoreductase n=1 Tax=unclassified Streptomyces TaxID=2593676 RepID=UPI000938D829|nr:SDR family oxidoreductase [Streptomyces sp. CB02414]OKI81335.1 short-chain dehydrogenase [Streptomyces sp. CB02414]
MPITLITGANKGLGRETARRLVEAGHTVYIGSRVERSGQKEAARLGARCVPIDITDDESVRAAAESVGREAGRLDVLVNNAGVIGWGNDALAATAEAVRRTYDTNVFGAVRVTKAFLPLLEASEAPVIVNVSSGLGSLSIAGDPESYRGQLPAYYPALAYNSSKAALNMLTAQYARMLPGFRINAVDPGHTATDLNGHTGPQTVAEGADVIVRMATVGPDGPTGGFFGNGGPVPW